MAGTGTGGFAGDGGPATAAQIFGPEGVAALPDGSFLVADRLDSRVRFVDVGGTITTIAGTGGFGNTGDGGPANLATFGSPVSVVPTADGGYLVVTVRDLRAGRTVIVRAPHSYLARATRAAATTS
ncbi:MAG: hypothetical protein QOJ35_3978 [Solirubrobacteraceae bacterium]|nr:hypothetical protein [Solirubrobacteraceae bacterium]